MPASQDDSSIVSYEDRRDPGMGNEGKELCELLQHAGTSPDPITPIACPSWITPESKADTHASYPWTRWVESLRSRRRRCAIPVAHVDGWFDGPSTVTAEYCKSLLAPSLQGTESCDLDSGRSSSILGRVKTASISVQTLSDPKSRTNTITSNSIVPSRRSADSNRSALYEMMPHNSKVRAVRRRHILREIYSSEANYVHGLQTLAQLLSTYITMRPAILRDLQRLCDMHSSFKKRLEAVSPQSAEATNFAANERHRIIQKFQNRPLLTRNLRRLVDGKMLRDWADPSEALLVAMEIDRLTAGFGLYESFIRTFDVLAEDLAILRQSRPADGFWAEGVEALSKSVDSTQRRKANGKKSLTVDDLMAMPIQRVCKYRLLLSELLKTVPESEYPLAHSKIKAVLETNAEAVDKINTVVGNPDLRMRIVRTLSLHERLEYDPSSTIENVYQDLGPLILCGVLHVAYRTANCVDGQYLACILFSSYIVFAKPRNESRKLILIASIYLSDMRVDTLTNGHGLACLDTPFSWKVVFQHNKKRHEVILSASSTAEERVWKTEILKASAMPVDRLPTLSLEARRFSFLSIPIQPLESDDRSLLLNRTASLRSFSSQAPLRMQQRHIIIKRTHNPIYDNEVRQLQDSDLARSRSVAKSNVRSPTVLMPLRWSRVKLERSIGDIFSHEMLPYPGMTLVGADYLQTQSMMRRSIIRGLSLRGVFTSQRSASLGKASALSKDDGQIAYDEKLDTAGDLSDEMETYAADNTTPVCPQSISGAASRRRLARPTSELVMSKPNDKGKHRSLWKWWPSSLTSFGLFRGSD